VFGEYRKQRHEITQNFLKQADLLDEQFEPEQVRPAREPQHAIPRLVDVRGTALDKIGDFKDLDPREPAVAIIDDVSRAVSPMSQSAISIAIGLVCQLRQMLHGL
jgi:hypothetical protein